MKIHTNDYVFETISGTNDFVFKVLSSGSEDLICSANICMIQGEVCEPKIIIHEREIRFPNTDYVRKALELLIRNVQLIWSDMYGKRRDYLVETGYFIA